MELLFIILTNEPKSSGPSFTDYFTIGGVIITGAISLIAAIKSSNTSKTVAKISSIDLRSARVADTISTQRIEWINNVRNCFADFHKSVFLHTKLLRKYSLDEHFRSEEIQQSISEAKYYSNLMELYLNPTEKIVKLLMKSVSKCIKEMERSTSPSSVGLEFSLKIYLTKITTYQQVILKAEWQIVRNEIKEGKELDKAEKEAIYLKVAKRIDQKIFEEMIKS
ncbi:hypothetical protein [Lysinibacillus sp. NPDC093692]|uniref:hypothetical protein n=1 Tax=Lysinibacillus sp. NPDC093692 TaxID=3390578 RepID=UPI003D06B3E2